MDCRLAFWTPMHAPADAGLTFGAAAHGYASAGVWQDPVEPGAGIWPHRCHGETVAGTYEDVMAQLERIAWCPAAAIIVFAHARGIEPFLQRWLERFSGVPVAGGGAALGAGQVAGELLPAAPDVAVLLIRHGEWRAESLNVHDVAGVPLEFRADGPRTITHLRDRGAWVPAANAFRAMQSAHRRVETDCESISLSSAGRNIHCRFDGELLHTGADLPADGRLEWRAVSRADAAKRLAGFCAVPDALIFGCAGLRGLLDAPLPVATGTLVGFMFGELVTLAGRPQFGNLMAARLTQVSTKGERSP